MALTLLPVTPDNIENYATFRLSVAGEETRSYYASTDHKATILNSKAHSFLMDGNHILAAVALKRKTNEDRHMSVHILVDPEKRDPQHLTDLTVWLLKSENPTPLAKDVIYHVYPPHALCFQGADMKAMGFSLIVENIKYLRDPGPSQDGEFPHAAKGEQLGYRAMVLDEKLIAKHPDIFTRMTDVYNRAFAQSPDMSEITVKDREKYYHQDDSSFVICMLEDDLTASAYFMKFENEVLVTELQSLRKHWGNGSVDLLCRHLVNEIAKRWHLPVLAYSDATNAASRRAMERFGLKPVTENLSWRRKIPAGSDITF